MNKVWVLVECTEEGYPRVMKVYPKKPTLKILQRYMGEIVAEYLLKSGKGFTFRENFFLEQHEVTGDYNEN